MDLKLSCLHSLYSLLDEGIYFFKHVFLKLYYSVRVTYL